MGRRRRGEQGGESHPGLVERCRLAQVTPSSRIPWMLRVSGSRRWVTGTRGRNGGSRHACAAWSSVSCQRPGPLTFGMYEGWLHGVKFLLEQPVRLCDVRPTCDRPCDLSQDVECVAVVEAE